MSTTSIVPRERPEMDRLRALALIGPALDRCGIAVLGRRGYYRDTMGKPGKNDIGMYDDAIMVVTPTEYRTFNANTDPSVSRDGIATLVPGTYLYQLGTHNRTKAKARQYEALIQAGEVVKKVQGGGAERGWFGINIHRGGENGTSSEGCQTIHPDQWEEFIGLVKGEMTKYGVKVIPYVLSERT